MIQPIAERELRGAAWCGYTEHTKSEFRACFPHRRADFHVGMRVAARRVVRGAQRTLRGGSFNLGWPAHVGSYSASMLGMLISRQMVSFRPARRV